MQLSCVRVALGPLAAVPHNVEHVALAVAHTWDETPPMAVIVAIEQARVVALTVIKVADDVHRMCLGGPDAKGRATGDEVRTHGGAGMDMIEAGRHNRSPLRTSCCRAFAMAVLTRLLTQSGSLSFPYVDQLPTINANFLLSKIS